MTCLPLFYTNNFNQYKRGFKTSSYSNLEAAHSLTILVTLLLVLIFSHFVSILLHKKCFFFWTVVNILDIVARKKICRKTDCEFSLENYTVER